jgi:hypothetical protein
MQRSVISIWEDVLMQGNFRLSFQKNIPHTNTFGMCNMTFLENIRHSESRELGNEVEMRRQRSWADDAALKHLQCCNKTQRRNQAGLHCMLPWMHVTYSLMQRTLSLKFIGILCWILSTFWSILDTHGISGDGLTPVFSWLVDIILTDLL